MRVLGPWEQNSDQNSAPALKLLALQLGKWVEGGTRVKLSSGLVGAERRRPSSPGGSENATRKR